MNEITEKNSYSYAAQGAFLFKYEYDRKRTGEQSYLERMMEKEKIGKYIRKKRIEKGMTQQQLAEKIQVTEKAVSRWETGVSQTKGY